MRMENFTPFPNLRFYGAVSSGEEFGVLLVKGTYRIGEDGRLIIADTQAPLALSDEYHGEVNASALRMPSDLVPKKPRADIVVNAVAHAPEGKAAGSWLCGVSVRGRHRVEKVLRVFGPREWHPRFSVQDKVLADLDETERRRVFVGWELGEPQPASSVPIRYEAAFGGTLRKPGDDPEQLEQVADERNPVGCGWIDREFTPIDKPVAAPRIEVADSPITDPYHLYEPAGLGAIPPAWLPRRPLAGTFDQDWIDNQWPKWPRDYRFSYHNSAHPDLIYPDHLTGEETIVLSGLDPRSEQRTIRLPGHLVIAQVDNGGGQGPMAPMDLDTLLIDIADDDPSRHRVHLSWRITFDQHGAQGIAMALVTPEDMASTAA